VLSSRQGAGIVRLTGGAVTSASAPGVRRLGEALLERGLIDGAQLEEALGLQETSRIWEDDPEALGSVLLANKSIERAQLGKVVFQQILDALEPMITWTEGAFSFHPADAESTAPPISFSVQQVILELMRQSDERNEAARVARH
jgi:hypothetical protein